MLKKVLFVQIAFIAMTAALIYLVFYKPGREARPSVAVIPSSFSLKGAAQSDLSPMFVSPSAVIDSDKHFIINFKPLRDKLMALKQAQKQKSYVYFAYLNNSSWIGLDEKEMFTAASTIKVPLAMAIYKMKEEGKLDMSTAYTLSDLDLDSNFGELYKIGSNKTLSIDDLVRIMLTFSDNTAMRALFKVMDLIGVHDPLASVYNAMGWEYLNFGTEPTYVDINLKTLSNMFLALYNASYNNVADSQKILWYLSQTPFSDQIVAGVTNGTLVSHKIGVNNQNDTYSDCGIVYAPNKPYILCIGSVGAGKPVADAFMKAISKEAYQYVINN